MCYLIVRISFHKCDCLVQNEKGTYLDFEQCDAAYEKQMFSEKQDMENGTFEPDREREDWCDRVSDFENKIKWDNRCYTHAVDDPPKPGTRFYSFKEWERAKDRYMGR
ncbi:hypothetical protein MMC25_003762 [Agyrium rufum]|nr:hypothetical protein [Agyrium rufum]